MSVEIKTTVAIKKNWLKKPDDCVCVDPNLMEGPLSLYFAGLGSGHGNDCPAHERWWIKLCLDRLAGNPRPRERSFPDDFLSGFRAGIRARFEEELR